MHQRIVIVHAHLYPCLDKPSAHLIVCILIPVHNDPDIHAAILSFDKCISYRLENKCEHQHMNGGPRVFQLRKKEAVVGGCPITRSVVVQS